MSHQNEGLKNALTVVGDKWSLAVLMYLYQCGPSRYNDCQKADGINTKTLSQRLSALEEAGLIVKRTYKEYPPRTEYEITEKGKTLAPVFNSLAHWGDAHMGTQSKVSTLKNTKPNCNCQDSSIM